MVEVIFCLPTPALVRLFNHSSFLEPSSSFIENMKTKELECRLLMATLELRWVKDSSWWWGTMDMVSEKIERWD